MALVGEAHIVVRAITRQLNRDIQNGFRGTSSVGNKAGNNLGKSFSKGFNQSGASRVFSDLREYMTDLISQTAGMSRAFSSVNRTGQFVVTTLGALIGALAAVIAAIGALGGNALGAAGSLAILGNAVFALGAGMIAAKLAFKGIGQALSELNKGGGGGASNLKAIEAAEKSLARTIESNREALLNANNAVRKAQLALNEALKAGREEIQQLGFDAEDAALAEKRAAIDLDKARLALAKAQDLPPNSRVRQEAELAYQEAELNYRRAKDKSADLNKEQDRLAKTGVAGTKTVINATNALAQAETAKAKTIRDGLRSEQDAQDALNDAKKGSGGGSQSAYDKLNAAQKQFVDFLRGEVLPSLKQLNVVAADAFLPKLETAIRTLMTSVFPVVLVGIGQVAAAMGNATNSIADSMSSAANLEKLASVFTTSGPLIESMGRVIGRIWGILLSIMVAAAPQAQRFFDFLDKKLSTFDNWLNTLEGKNAIANYFQLAGDAMADWGNILGNILGGFGAIIRTNLGPGTGGQFMLDWLKESTGRFKALDDTVDKSDSLKKWFRGAAENATKVLDSIGGLIKGLGGLADDKNIGKTWDNLAKGTKFVVSIAEKAIAAGPAMGNLISKFAEVIDLLVDATQAQYFFDTLSWAMDKLIAFLSTDIVQKIVKFTAPFQGIALAIGGLTAATIVFGKIFLGYLVRFGQFIAPILRLLNPWTVAIMLIAGAFIYLWNTSEKFRDVVMGVLGEVSSAFGDMFSQIAGPGMSLFDTLAKTFQILLANIEPFITVLVKIVGSLLVNLAPILGSIFTALITTLDTLVKAIGPLIPVIFDALSKSLEALMPLIPALLGALGEIIDVVLALIPPILDALLPVFSQLIAAILPLIPLLIQSLMPAILAIIKAIAPLVTMFVNALIPVFTRIMAAIVPLITLLLKSLVPAITKIIEAIAPLITKIVEALVPAFVAIMSALEPIFGFLIDLLVPIIEVLVAVLGAVINVIITVASTIIQFLLVALDFVVTAITNVITWFTNFMTAIHDILTAVFKFISDIFQNIADFIVDTVTWISDTWIAVWTAISDFFMGIFKAIVKFVTDYMNRVSSIISGVISFISDVWVNFWNGFGKIVSDIWNNIIGFVRGGANFVISGIESMVNGAIDLLNTLAGGINKVIGPLGDAIGINIKIPKIPHIRIPRLADGGTVFPSRGGSIVNVAEAGKPERIEPLDADGLSKRDKALIAQLSSGNGMTVHIHAVPNQSVNELAEEVSRRISFMMRKGS